jgi:tRNA-uridine 2-sulfurtransferase
MNWLGDGALDAIPASGLEVFAKVRSTRPPRPAVLFHDSGVTSVELVDGESGIAPGQACVLYTDDSSTARVLGGGYIARSQRAPEAEAMLKRLEAVE